MSCLAGLRDANWLHSTYFETPKAPSFAYCGSITYSVAIATTYEPRLACAATTNYTRRDVDDGEQAYMDELNRKVARLNRDLGLLQQPLGVPHAGSGKPQTPPNDRRSPDLDELQQYVDSVNARLTRLGQPHHDAHDDRQRTDLIELQQSVDNMVAQLRRPPGKADAIYVRDHRNDVLLALQRVQTRLNDFRTLEALSRKPHRSTNNRGRSRSMRTVNHHRQPAVAAVRTQSEARLYTTRLPTLHAIRSMIPPRRVSTPRTEGVGEKSEHQLNVSL